MYRAILRKNYFLEFLSSSGINVPSVWGIVLPSSSGLKNIPSKQHKLVNSSYSLTSILQDVGKLL